jgi:hypothetical protein
VYNVAQGEDIESNKQTIEFVSEKLTEEWVCAMVPRVNILSKTTN